MFAGSSRKFKTCLSKIFNTDEFFIPTFVIPPITVIVHLLNLKHYVVFVFLRSASVPITSLSSKINVIVPEVVKQRARVPTDEERKFEARITIRKARSEAKLVGQKLKKQTTKDELGDQTAVKKKRRGATDGDN